MGPTPAELSVRWLPDDDGWRLFELTSRGDHVTVRLHTPDRRASRPLAIVLGEPAAEIGPVEGCATLTLDLPLFGARARAKWSHRLQRCLADGAERESDRALLDEFRSQAAADLGRALDVCRALPEVGSRSGLLGLGAGAWVGARLRASEPRLGVVILAPGDLAASLDPREPGAAPPPDLVFVRDAAEGIRRLGEALA